MPYQYFHMLNLLVTLNLAVWAYGLGVTDSLLAPLSFFMSALIFMGFMDLANQLVDPFGDDDPDFPVHHWATELLQNLVVLLDFSHGGVDDSFKQDLDEEAQRRALLSMDFAAVEGLVLASL